MCRFERVGTLHFHIHAPKRNRGDKREIWKYGLTVLSLHPKPIHEYEHARQTYPQKCAARSHSGLADRACTLVQRLYLKYGDRFAAGTPPLSGAVRLPECLHPPYSIIRLTRTTRHWACVRMPGTNIMEYVSHSVSPPGRNRDRLSVAPVSPHP